MGPRGLGVVLELQERRRGGGLAPRQDPRRAHPRAAAVPSLLGPCDSAEPPSCREQCREQRGCLCLRPPAHRLSLPRSGDF